ncbi:hypothetical protein HMPREF9420_2636 [Segatella salivae DSM 15606]|uniref:Uncharacterized protein n=1 Tax=Segatella salivae DSM 15606 TaxID=888832 RepID=E6MT18_9BACT|nr:hypothetical protein HMPREF9420_2636 [Segatella salivae DSM 15606]
MNYYIFLHSLMFLGLCFMECRGVGCVVLHPSYSKNVKKTRTIIGLLNGFC